LKDQLVFLSHLGDVRMLPQLPHSICDVKEILAHGDDLPLSNRHPITQVLLE
jgi:hypothetical protein